MKIPTTPFITLSTTVCFLGLALPVMAFTMSNTNYILEWGNLNTAAGKSTGDGKTLTLTVGQTIPGLFSGTNFKVRSGFQYFYSIIPFSFRITSIEVTFGVLTPNNPVTRTNSLIVSNGSANGYSVTAMQSSQLIDPASGALIPNTTCDNGLCTTTTSDAWTSDLVYGFGYRCDNETGTDCASGFSDATYYKQFSASPSATTVMTGTAVGRNKRVRITYKANISQTQAAGQYRNVITYIATPTF